MNAQEVATCCRVAWRLMGGKDRGPGLSQVKADTLFVRDGDFMYELALELAREMGKSGVSELWAELMASEKQSNEENAEARRRRSEALVVASDVVDVMRGLRRDYPERWGFWKKMIAGQTLRQIERRTEKRLRPVMRASIAWISGAIEAKIGEEGLEKLLTLRMILA